MNSKNKVEKSSILLLVLLGFSTLFFYDPLNDNGNTLCLVKNIFYIECPGCGLFKGSYLFWKGKWLSASHYNLLTVPINICFLIGVVLLITDLSFNLRFFEEKFINLLFVKYKYLVLSIIISNYLLKQYLSITL